MDKSSVIPVVNLILCHLGAAGRKKGEKELCVSPCGHFLQAGKLTSSSETSAQRNAGVIVHMELHGKAFCLMRIKKKRRRERGRDRGRKYFGGHLSSNASAETVPASHFWHSSFCASPVTPYLSISNRTKLKLKALVNTVLYATFWCHSMLTSVLKFGHCVLCSLLVTDGLLWSCG